MEVNCVAEALFIPEATAAHLNHLDQAIDALSTAIIGLEHHGIDDAPEVIFDCRGDLLDGFKAASHSPGQPAFPSLSGPDAAGVIPQGHGQASGGTNQRHGQSVPHLIVERGTPVSRFKSVRVMPEGIRPDHQFIDKASGWLIGCDQCSQAYWQTHEANGVVDDMTLLHVHRWRCQQPEIKARWCD